MVFLRVNNLIVRHAFYDKLTFDFVRIFGKVWQNDFRENNDWINNFSDKKIIKVCHKKSMFVKVLSES